MKKHTAGGSARSCLPPEGWGLCILYEIFYAICSKHILSKISVKIIDKATSVPV